MSNIRILFYYIIPYINKYILYKYYKINNTDNELKRPLTRSFVENP